MWSVSRQYAIQEPCVTLLSIYGHRNHQIYLKTSKRTSVLRFPFKWYLVYFFANNCALLMIEITTEIVCDFMNQNLKIKKCLLNGNCFEKRSGIMWVITWLVGLLFFHHARNFLSELGVCVRSGVSNGWDYYVWRNEREEEQKRKRKRGSESMFCLSHVGCPFTVYACSFVSE